jgi:hypothetical protein
MHLIFLGIMKSSLFNIKKWLGMRGCLTDFLDRCSYLNRLLDDVRLEWLKVQDFREGKFGGWVAENFVAFSRIVLWFFQDVSSLLREDLFGEDSIPPTEVPQNEKEWQVKHYKRWFYDRGLEPFKGTKAQMRVEVLRLLNQPQGPPPLRDPSQDYAPEQVERVLVSLDSMITVLMTEEVDPDVTCPLAELRIKHFLAEFDILNQSVLKVGEKPKVVTASNYLTLLNLPDTIRHYGSLREYYEGMFCGEGFVRVVKPYLRYGLKPNFSCNAMSHCHREAMLDMAELQLDGCGATRKEAGGSHLARTLKSSRANFSTYDSREDAADRLSRQKVLSIVVFLGKKEDDGSRNMHAYVANRCDASSSNPHKLQLHKLIQDLTVWNVKLTLKYSEWSVAGTPTNWGVLERAYPQNVFELTFGCLLPEVSEEGESRHTLVCMDRTVRY